MHADRQEHLSYIQFVATLQCPVDKEGCVHQIEHVLIT
jgi:hypothetical protein